VASEGDMIDRMGKKGLSKATQPKECSPVRQIERVRRVEILMERGEGVLKAPGKFEEKFLSTVMTLKQGKRTACSAGGKAMPSPLRDYNSVGPPIRQSRGAISEGGRKPIHQVFKRRGKLLT